MFKYTVNTLKKIEGLIKSGGYILRYEKGHFKSGYCVLDEKKVVVVNKFFNLETRIEVLIELIQELSMDVSGMTAQELKILDSVKLHHATLNKT